MSPLIEKLFGLCVVALFETILLEEQSFDLQPEIVHIGIFYSLCLAVWLSTACECLIKNIYEYKQDF